LPRLSLLVSCCSAKQQVRVSTWIRFRWKSWRLVGHFCVEINMLATGTPSGVGVGMVPPIFLKVGDAVRVEVEGIGHIDNTVIPEPVGI
jgi:hypothetical protein